MSVKSVYSRFTSGKRGQFVILASVIIVAFMFSLVLSVSQISTSRLEVSYDPIDEVVLTIASDFERCLARSLSIATQKFYEKYVETGDPDKAKRYAEEIGKNFINNWLRATIESYNGLGINIVLTPENSSGVDYVDWMINCEGVNGVSAVYTTFNIDIEAYGLRNLAMTLQRIVHLDIDTSASEIKLADAGINVVITFRIWEESEGRRFIIGLTPSNLKLLADNEDINYEVKCFEYMGRGTYRAQFSLENLLAEKITLITTINDGTRVAASMGLCSLILRSDNLATMEIDDEGVFIIQNNGRTLSPPYVLPLLPGQSLTISFTPPEGEFLGFSSSGGPINVEAFGSSAIVNIVGEGVANLIAQYISFPESEPPPPSQLPQSTCYITFTSRKYDDITLNKGTFLLIFPNGTLHIFIDDESSEMLNEISETLNEIVRVLNAELDINLLELVNGSLFTLRRLPVNNFPVPYNQTLRVIYIPRIGYFFKSWDVSNTIVVKKSLSYFIFSYMRFVALGNGTIVAVYDGSRPAEWRVLYISPKAEKGVLKKDSFVLELTPELLPEQVTPPLNNPHDKRSGNTTKTTPMLYLGKNVMIILHAKYTKGGSKIDVKVTLGFYTSEGSFHEIGGGTISVPKSSTYLPYTITFKPNVDVIPSGSKIALILERTDNNSGGTLHLLCGLLGSRIELWQPWE